MTPEQLRQWRLDHNLTQRECAEIIRYTLNAWQNLEYGKRRIHPSIPAMLEMWDKSRPKKNI